MVAVLTVFVVLKATLTARASSFDLQAGFGYSGSDSESENKLTGDKSESSFTSLSQAYNLYFSRDFFPYLIFSGGGNFRIDDTDSQVEGNRTEVERTHIRPYLELKLENPFIQTGIGYQDSEIRQKVSGTQETTRFSKTHYSFLSLRPDQMPELDLRISKTDRFDAPETTNRVEKLATLQTRYFYEGLNLHYTFTQNNNEDKLNDFETRFRNHSAKIRYDRSYLDGRVNISTGYWIAQAKIDLEGTGSALIPILRWAGLYSLDLTPEDGPALEPIGGLIDGNTVAPTSLDIGLAGDETTLTNIGVNLGVTTSVDTIHLWVDRELTPEVSDSFAWYVYTSPDNTDSSDWQLHATVSPGDFGVFENRFEISFPVVDTQFIKVAVMPLLPSVPGASGFPNIFVTEMEIFTTLTDQDEYSATNQKLDLSIGWRASDETSLGYDWFLRNQKSDPGNVETSSMTNGVFVNHTFNNTFTGITRISQLDRMDPDKKTSTSSFSASLRAQYIETFQQTLTYSATRKHGDQGSSKNDSVFLKNNADLYDGVNTYLDAGVSWGENEDRDSTMSRFLRIGSNLVPNEKVTMKLDYRADWSHISGEEERLKESGNFQAFVLPSLYLSLFARLGYDKSDTTRRTSQRYSLTWSPSLGASVQFFLFYEQSIESEGNREVKTLSPGLRWRITRYATLRTTYSWFDSESNTDRTNSRNLTANLDMNL